MYVCLPIELEKLAGDLLPWATWKLGGNHGLSLQHTSLSVGRAILHKLFNFMLDMGHHTQM